MTTASAMGCSFSKRAAGTASALFALCFVVSGCGGGACSVSGQITFDGQPVQHGTIRLDPIEGTPGRAAVAPIEAGRYEFRRRSGLRPGKHQVLILAARSAGGTTVPGQSLPAKPSGRAKARPDAGREEVLRSDSVVELGTGENTKDFDLGSGLSGLP